LRKTIAMVEDDIKLRRTPLCKDAMAMARKTLPLLAGVAKEQLDR